MRVRNENLSDKTVGRNRFGVPWVGTGVANSSLRWYLRRT